MDHPDCRTFADEVCDLAGGALSGDRSAALRGHADACPACARLLAREVRLRAWLLTPDPATPPVPERPPLPDLPRTVPTILRWAVASAAAAAIAAALLVPAGAFRSPGSEPGTDTGTLGRDSADSASRAEILRRSGPVRTGPTAVRMRDSPAPGSWDERPSSPAERWLAFDAGAEFVASRRVAEGR